MTIFPPELEQRYHGKQHIERLPFIINKPVADELVLGALASKELKPNDVFMGVAGLRALDLLSSAGRESGQRYQHAVLFDVNYRQVKMTNVILQLIKESATPEQFIFGFEKYYGSMLKPSQQSTSVFAGVHGAFDACFQPRNAAAAAEYLRSRMTKKDSFLDTENFSHLKHMLDSSAIHTAVLDICDQERVGTLAAWLERNHLRVSDMYVSSMLEFMISRRFNDYWNRSNERKRPDACTSLNKLLKEYGDLIYSASSSDSTVAFELAVCPADRRTELLEAIFGHDEAKVFSDVCAGGTLSYPVSGGARSSGRLLAFRMRTVNQDMFSEAQVSMLKTAILQAFAEQGKAPPIEAFFTSWIGKEFGAYMKSGENLTPDIWQIIVECINSTIIEPRFQAASVCAHRPYSGGRQM